MTAIGQQPLEETMSKDGEVRMRSRWSINADGVTMHARFENTKGEVFEQSGHKVMSSTRVRQEVEGQP